MTSANHSSDEAMKARIIAHVNKDHTSSLSRYLEAFKQTSILAARAPILKDISLSSLTVQSSPTLLSSPQVHIVSLSPPMSSLSEARLRLVELDAEATEKMGLEKDTVTPFLPPSLLGTGLIVGVIAGMFLFTDGSYFAPDSLLARTLFAPAPRAAHICERRHWLIWSIMMSLHFFETWILLGRLRRWNVRLFSNIWWEWVICQFFEGIGCLRRFRGETERLKRARMEKEGKDGVGH